MKALFISLLLLLISGNLSQKCNYKIDLSSVVDCAKLRLDS